MGWARPQRLAVLAAVWFLSGDTLANDGMDRDAGTTEFTSVALASGDAGSGDEVDEAAGAAREAFKRGAALARGGRWSDALAAFERSAELRSHAVTTYNLAYCERALRRYTRARKLFARALSDHKARGGIELPEDLIAAADDYLAEAERKVARLAVKLSPADAAVSVDGAPLEMVAAEVGRPLLTSGTRKPGPPEVVGSGSFELLLDPGPHRFVLVRAGYRDVALDRALEAGERGELELGAAKVLPAAEGAAEHPASPSRLPAYAAFGLGAAGLAVGVTAGIIALGKRSALDDRCQDKQCYDGQDGNSTLQAARTAANVSTIGFLIGAGGTAAGAALWWLTSPTHAQRRSSGSLPGFSTSVGPGSIAFVTRF